MWTSGRTKGILQAKKRRYDPDRLNFQQVDNSLAIAGIKEISSLPSPLTRRSNDLIEGVFSAFTWEAEAGASAHPNLILY